MRDRPTAPATGRVVVVGVGEPTRADDGCGPSVVRSLRGRVPREVELVERVGDPSTLLDLWDGAGLAVVVDAMRSGARPGTVRRLDGRELASAPGERATSSHGFSVRDAYRLGDALGRLPRRLVAYLIEAGNVGAGETLSPEVAVAVGRTARSIAAEVCGRELGLGAER